MEEIQHGAMEEEKSESVETEETCENKAMEIEEESGNMVCESYAKENAKISEWYNYQIGVYNVYYVLAVLLVTIIAKFYLSLNRMYSLR